MMKKGNGARIKMELVSGGHAGILFLFFYFEGSDLE
jgi:hypothetical protein